MAIGLVHDVQALIAFGFTYRHIHERKDAASRHAPGLRHRRVGHGWYRAFGRRWNFADPFPDAVKQRTQRIGDARGPVRAEEYMVSVSHDYLDKIWDFDDLSREERKYTRKYWEAFHIWLVLNPEVLKNWAGVDVPGGRIHRVVDGNEVWEEAPEVKSEYKRLYDRACFVLRLDGKLQCMLEKYGGLPLSNEAEA